MTFTHTDQVSFARVALRLLDQDDIAIKEVETMLNFGELIKRYSGKDNSVIFDITEYLYEQFCSRKGDDGVYVDESIRRQLEKDISSHQDY